MSTFTNKLDDFEFKLKTFVEGKLSRLSPTRGIYDGIAHQLIFSMRAGTISTGDGILLAPDQFILLVHPTNLGSLSEDQKDMLIEMANLIKSIGIASGFQFSHHPIVTISPNEDIPTNKVDIVARISDQSFSHTANLDNHATPGLKNLPRDAFLIIPDMEIFPLNQSVINIGRRSNNHLSIDDPRVSRQHAQIRAISGRYEIFDLDSTGGTFINQKRIKQSLLHPGDVISLAGVHLIYGQERSSSVKYTKKLISSKNNNQPDSRDKLP